MPSSERPAASPPLVHDESIYRLLVEQALDYAVFLLDPKGIVSTWNRGAEIIKGYRADEIIGRSFTAFYTPEALARNWPARELELAAAHGHLEDEGWRVKKDGTRFWANVVISAVRDSSGGLLGFSKITRDLTERRRHEEQLRESEERFRLLVEGVTDYAIYLLSPEGLITSWNSGATRITGYSQDEVLGSHFSRFSLGDDLDSRAGVDLENARRVGRSEVEGWLLTKDGRRFRARVVLTPLLDSEGALRGFAQLTQDLTEHQHVVALEQAAKRVSEFISVLAHELRNPLAPIRNAVEVIDRLPPSSPKIRDLHRIIDRQSAQLVRIVDDMLDMSRIAKGMVSIRRLPLDLSEPIHRAVETVAPLLESRQHELIVDCPEQPIHVSGDLNRLAQLLANLLSNAARYTEPGGHIAIRARSDQREAIVDVIDDGRGIPPAAIESMFEMFVRKQPLQDISDGGLGIGLALARKIAELHGGTLTGKSKGEGRGSEFTLRLPLLAEFSAQRPVHREEAAGDGASVFIVDDSPDARWALGQMLEALGYQVRTFGSAQEALASLPALLPSIILLDIGMPGVDGLEMAKRVRAAGHREALLVAVTGWGQAQDREKSRAAGFDFHLVKPVSLDALRGVLDSRRQAPQR